MNLTCTHTSDESLLSTELICGAVVTWEGPPENDHLSSLSDQASNEKRSTV